MYYLTATLGLRSGGFIHKPVLCRLVSYSVLQSLAGLCCLPMSALLRKLRLFDVQRRALNATDCFRLIAATIVSRCGHRFADVTWDLRLYSIIYAAEKVTDGLRNVKASLKNA